jgi:hypothetical protein
LTGGFMDNILGDQTIGSEIFQNKAVMFFKSFRKYVFSFLLCAGLVFLGSAVLIYPRLGPLNERVVYNAALRESVILKIFFWTNDAEMVYPNLNGTEIRMKRGDYVKIVMFPSGEDPVAEFRKNFVMWLWITLIFTFAGGIGGLFGWRAISVRLAKKHLDSVFIRGARLIEENNYRKILKKKGGDIPVAFEKGKETKPIMWSKKAETEHLLILKRPGMGGTVMMMNMLQKTVERGDRCLIFDYKGDYTEKFYRKEVDIILNPFDIRSLNYSFFAADVAGTTDINMIANIIVPHVSGATQPYFDNASRDILSSLFEILYRQGKKSNADIYEHASLSLEDLAYFLRKNGASDAAAHLEKSETGGNTAALNVKSNLQSRVSFLKQSRAIDISGGSFSLRDWAVNGKGNVFLSANPSTIDSVKTLYSIYLDLLFNFLLSLPDDLNRRIFIFLDEFGNLPRLSKISEVLSAGRSKGISIVLSLQSIDQLREKFGDKGADVVNSLFGSFALFAVEGHTKKFCSELIGKTVVSEVEHSMSFGPNDIRDGFSMQRREKEKDLVKDAEFGTLEKLHYYLRVGGMKEWTLTRTIDPQIKSFPILNEAFIPKPDSLHKIRIDPSMSSAGNLTMTIVQALDPSFKGDIIKKAFAKTKEKSTEEPKKAKDFEY